MENDKNIKNEKIILRDEKNLLNKSNEEDISNKCVIQANWRDKAVKVMCSTPQLIIIAGSAIAIFAIKALQTFLHTLHLIKK